MTLYGQQLARETEATETAQADELARQPAAATAYALAHPRPTATEVPTNTPAPPPVPTSTCTPTATPLPTIAASAATLGGAVTAFDAKFGAQNCCYLNGWTVSRPSGQQWIGVIYDGYPQQGFDETSSARVTGIDDVPTDVVVWTGQQALAACSAYLPPDATYLSGHPVYLANLVKGYTRLY